MSDASNFQFDLFVIGAGSGGVRAARIASQLGARVAIAEDLYMGGTCVNVGCVPKKLFVYASHYKEDFEDAKNFGWNSQPADFDWLRLRDNKTAEIQRLNGIYNNILEGAGVTVIEGRGKLRDANTVEVGGKLYSAARILIATGGWPKQPSYPGAELTVNSNQFFYMESFPKSVIVEGGGYIAVEFAGILNGLGVATELVYRGPKILKHFDADIAQFAAQQISDKGIHLSLNTTIREIKQLDNKKLQVSLLHTDEQGKTVEKTVDVDAVVTAIGRDPKTSNLGLEDLGVELKRNGAIKVNDNFQTNIDSIYAVGDVIDRVALTPVALAEGMALARYLFAQQPINLDYKNIATAVFCQPNIATVGYTEEQARAEQIPVTIYRSEFRALKNTISGSTERTLMKLIVNSDNDRVIGAHMVGPEAGEIIQGIAIAISAGATKSQFDNTIGIHPTAAEEFVTMREPYIAPSA